MSNPEAEDSRIDSSFFEERRDSEVAQALLDGPADAVDAEEDPGKGDLDSFLRDVSRLFNFRSTCSLSCRNFKSISLRYPEHS